MPEQEWTEPKTDFVATDQVTPNIFNTLGKNTKYLLERKTGIEQENGAGDTVPIATIVFVED